MHPVFRRLLLAPMLLTLSQHSVATDFGGYVTLTTDYVKRGVTQSDGDPALQLGADLDFENGFYAGAWGSTIDIANGPSRQRDLEFNYYAGYHFDVSDTWQLSVSAVAYDYRGDTGPTNYDYQEVSFAGNYDDRVWLEASYSPDLYHSGRSVTNLHLFTEWPVNSVWAVSAGLGYYDTSNFIGRSYRYWQLGATASLQRVDVDFRFHDNDGWVPIVSSPQRAESRFSLTLQIPF